MSAPPIRVRAVVAVADAQVAQLAEVLVDCVEGGASVSFMHPLSRARAEAFWRGVARGVEAGERALLIAEDGLGVCGTVQLVLAQPENQPHRADIKKLLVHRRARRHGLAHVVLLRLAHLVRFEERRSGRIERKHHAAGADGLWLIGAIGGGRWLGDGRAFPRNPRPAKAAHCASQRLRMSVTLSTDHRVVDGALGAQFLQALKALIEDPLALLL